jgi:hypothetical protein
MSQTVTGCASNCADCPMAANPVTDPVRILERLPARLFNRQPPAPGIQGAQFPVQLDVTQFGELPAGEPTPQYEIARIIAAEKDRFVGTWRHAVALQHGLGLLTVDPDTGQVKGQCPRAAGVDLDRVGEQFGIGRPLGFTDCCYWRLVLLMLFKPATTLWLIREIAELYTGVRPMVVEQPARLILIWPGDEGDAFLDQDWFLNQNTFLGGEGAGVDSDESDLFLDNPADPKTFATFLSDGSGIRAGGLSLQQAIGTVKSAGVFVQYQDLPQFTAGGCYGASLRGPIGGEFFVS